MLDNIKSLAKSILNKNNTNKNIFDIITSNVSFFSIKKT